MATPKQVTQQIKYQLQQLTPNNAHHEFEHLCRDFARYRICKNILPATGPVSAGGDQGRDFETFKVFIDPSYSTFKGQFKDKHLVFACTLNKDVKPKIKEDVKSIIGKGSSTDIIYYFCIVDIPVALRHEIKDHIREEFNIDLEILDLQALSEQLSQPDLFWIAESYLSIPNEIYPKQEENHWYKETILKARQTGYVISSYALLLEARQAADFALAHEGLRSDLNFWKDTLLKYYLAQDNIYLKQKALYTLIRLCTKGLDDCNDIEEEISKHLLSLTERDSLSILNDSAIMFAYYFGYVASHGDLQSHSNLKKVGGLLMQLLEIKISKTDSLTERCLALQLKGYLYLFDHPEKSLEVWSEFIDDVERVPLFPLTTLSELVTMLAEKLEEHPLYSRLEDKINHLIREHEGNKALASKLNNRAIDLYQRGKPLKALSIIHSVRELWFRADTLHGSLLSMVLISKIYRDLGMHFAAKYYGLSLSGNSIASDLEEKHLAAKGIAIAIENEYLSGGWFGVVELSNIGIESALALLDDDDLGPIVNPILFYLSTVYVLSDRFGKDVGTKLKKFSEDQGQLPYIDSLLAKAKQSYDKKGFNSVWESFEQLFSAPPFNDAGPVRNIRFVAGETKWSFNWDNNFTTNSLGERIVAVLQAFIVELAEVELYLPETTIQINLQISEVEDPEFLEIPSNVSSSYSLNFPRDYIKAWRPKDIEVNILALICKIYSDISYLPAEECLALIQPKLESKLSNKIFTSAILLPIDGSIVDEERFIASERSSVISSLASKEFNSNSSKFLKSLSTLSTRYNVEEAHQAIQKRYDRAKKICKLTLSRIINDPQKLVIVQELREDGWKDWHLLLSISSIVINYRNHQSGEKSLEALKVMTMNYAEREENEDDPLVPLDLISKQSLQDHLSRTMVSTLGMYGLRINRNTPHFEDLRRLLNKKFRYWQDDIDHDPIFPTIT